ncbi:hypothetical protein K9K77_02075 [Candidatus Babeliales bacterium]|nr:hypothetical protein [Candidatus Babeliales bacterium]
MKKQLLLVALLSVGIMNIEARTLTLQEQANDTKNGKNAMGGVFTKVMNKLSAAKIKLQNSGKSTASIRYGLATLYGIRYSLQMGKDYLTATKPTATLLEKQGFKATSSGNAQSISQFLAMSPEDQATALAKPRKQIEPSIVFKGLVGFVISLIQDNDQNIQDIINQITGFVSSTLNKIPLVPSTFNVQVVNLLKSTLVNSIAKVSSALTMSTLSQDEIEALEEAAKATEDEVEADMEIDLDDL